MARNAGRFDGRAVIVTGSSNGIGRATAVMFAKEGAMVTICGRDEKTLNKLLVVQGDLRDEDVMKETVNGTVRKFGRLDVLVNNAGNTGGSCWAEPEIEGDISYFDHTMNLNTRSVLRTLPASLSTSGEEPSSVTGLNNGASTPFPFYSVSKAAQDQLTRNLALHYIKKGVRVNSVNPGIISTNIVQRRGLSDEQVKQVNNAGNTGGSCWAEPEIEGDISYFDHTMNLNTRSSVTGLNNGASTPFPFYSVSKAAQDQLTRNLALHYIKKGVRGEEQIGASDSCVPYGRAGTPDEVAEAILFLADRWVASKVLTSGMS
ncbi:oxidoreductase, short chain dehydrogenase/reductase family protein [Cooperia oncophora]